MRNPIITTTYPLPQQPGSFELSLPAKTQYDDSVCLGIITLNGKAQLLVREEKDFAKREQRDFVLVETGSEIPSSYVRDGYEYLGSFEFQGKHLHLFGPRTSYRPRARFRT